MDRGVPIRPATPATRHISIMSEAFFNRMHAVSRAVHKGYHIIASTGPAHAGLHAANVVIERVGQEPYTFHALDYFYDAQQAVSYATQWGRLWVDSHG
jgi:hypothetical protein